MDNNHSLIAQQQEKKFNFSIPNPETKIEVFKNDTAKPFSILFV
jgi:hypothetical protein